MDKDDQHRKMIPAASGEPSTEFSSASKLAIYHAKLILGSYRVDQAANAEIYVTAISHVLSRYKPEIGAQLTDPHDGIAGKYKWLPTVSEVREEAERMATADRKEQERDVELQKQWALRDEMDTAEKLEPPEYRRQVIDRIRAELRESGFRFKGDPKPQETWKQFSADELLAKYGERP